MTTETKMPTPAPPTKARGGTPKSTGVSLKDAAGNMMRIAASAKKDGTARSYVIHRIIEDNKTKSVTRGATQVHASLEEARAAVEKLKVRAIAAGWIARAAAVGRSKPDAFGLDNLPSPKKRK